MSPELLKAQADRATLRRILVTLLETLERAIAVARESLKEVEDKR